MAVRLACARLSLCNLCSKAFQNNARSTVEFRRQFVSDHIAPKPPKRPLTAFMIFMEMKRSEIVQNNPGISCQDTGRVAGEMYRNLEEQEIENLKSQAAERLKAWQVVYQEFKANLTKEQEQQITEEKKSKKVMREKRRRRKVKRQLGKPKKPLNSFFVYLRASQIERGDAPTPQFVKGLAEHWKLLPEEDKKMYVEEANRESERYKCELKEWTERMIAEGHEDVLSPKKPKKVKSVKRNSVKSKKGTAKKTRKPKTKRAAKKKQMPDSSDSDD